MPGPRAAAAAVIGMLGFGVIVGSLVGGTSVATLASAPLIVVGLGHTTPAATTVHSAAVSQASGGAEGGSGGGAAAASQAGTAQASASPSTSPTSATGSGTGTDASSATGFGGLPPVKHVFLIVLSDRRFTKSFGAGAQAGYLGGALRRQGELIYNYYAVAGAPLANEIALVSGQGPTAQTASDCPVFSRIKPAARVPAARSWARGACIPPPPGRWPSQLTTAGEHWKAYLQGASKSSTTACEVPKLGSKEPQTARTSTSYLAWRDPFVYFRSLTGGGACRTDEVGLGPARDRSEERRHHAVARLHRPLAVRRRQRGAVQAARLSRAGRSQPLPEVGRARDQALARLQGRRPDRNHVRPGASDRFGRRLERVLRTRLPTRTCAR